MIRETIITAMAKRELTAYALAKLAELDPGVVKRYVNGKTDMTASNLEKVFAVLGLVVGYADD